MLVSGMSVDGMLTWYISIDGNSTLKNENDTLLIVRLNIFYVYFYLPCELFIHIIEMLMSSMYPLYFKMIKFLSYGCNYFS